MRRASPPIRTTDDDDDVTLEERRAVAFGAVQAKAGLTYGPFEKGGLSLSAFLKRHDRTRRVSIRIPEVLLKHRQHEAWRFGMRAGELMRIILETHQFKDQSAS
jgi:hypothetical protein